MKILKKLAPVFSRKPEGPVHEHSVCPNCKYLGKAPLGDLVLDIYACTDKEAMRLVAVFGETIEVSTLCGTKSRDYAVININRFPKQGGRVAVTCGQ